MGWRFQVALLALLFAIFAPALAFAEKRVALVIGNSAYSNVPPLANPRNDASDMAAKLQGLGFEVVSGLDLDLAQMRATVRDFIKRLEGAHMALYFYAGHGLQVNGINYMAPVDAKLGGLDDLEFEAMPMDLVLTAMERNAKVNLAFLDACRNNPLAQNLARSMGTRAVAVGNGLARLGSGVGSLIAFATQPGNVALDGTGRNSPFTAALLKHLGTPGQDITRDLIFVRRDVLGATDGKQVPWDNSSLTGEVILLEGQQQPAAQIEVNSAERTALQNRISELEAAQKAREAEDAARTEAERKLRDEERKKAELSKLAEETAVKSGAVPPAKAETKFDKSLLARLDPNAANAEPETRSDELSPEKMEEQLQLGTEDYKRVQSALNVLGYNAGQEDGVFSAASRAELRKYQIRNRQKESGYLTEQTLLTLLKTIESVPRSYDGSWQLEFHRYNYLDSDPVDINGRTLLAVADVELRNGEFFITSSQMFTSDKNYFGTFAGKLTKDGKLSVKMRLNTLFGKIQERDVSAAGSLPKLVPFDSNYSIRGSKLWTNDKVKNDQAWLRLDIRRIKS